MILYANYLFYIEEYKGELSNDLFNSLIPRASREIDKVVNRELTEEDIDDKIRYVACQLVDFLNENKESNVSSISIDGVSKSYRTQPEQIQKKREILSLLPHEFTRYL